MSQKERIDEIHISEIDVYLAARMVEGSDKPLGLMVEKSGDEGYITLTDTKESRALREEAIDFELSPSEYLNLDDRELDDLLASPLVTSSALELFDFLLLRSSKFSCLLEFTGNAWKVKVTLEPL
jgi:hypothetical protein